MIRVENLTYGIGPKDLYDEMSFDIEDGRHAVLIGINGTGKSTLVDMLVNSKEYSYDGEIEISEEYRIGYADQFDLKTKEQSITAAQFLAADFLRIEEEIAVICNEMAISEDFEPLLEKYQQLFDLKDSMDGDNYESNIHKELGVAGLLSIKDTQLSDISGGEYKVLQIIREMLKKPNLLILDEPDAFLDFENLGNLCNLINDYQGTMLVITHNRYLLNHCFDEVLHLENKEIFQFDGTYSEYRCFQFRERIERKREYLQEESEIQHTEALVERLRKRATLMVNPTIGRSVNAKQSQLDRMLRRHMEDPEFEFREPEIRLPEVGIPARGIQEIDVEEISVSPVETATAEASCLADEASALETDCVEAPSVEIATAEAACVETPSTTDMEATVETSVEEDADSNIVLEVSDYNTSFGDFILEKVNFQMKRGEKVAIVGSNGAGKTTLIYDIVRNDNPAINMNPDAKVAFLSQLQGNSEEQDKTVLQYMRDAGYGSEEEIEEVLYQYSLGDLSIKQKVRGLSVGEQNLLQIAKIANSDADFLILDEPTSHLDVYAQSALEVAIKEYQGTVLMISHDFYLITACADYVLYIEDNTLRRLRARTFRKMVYDKYFNVKYLEIDKRRQELELEVQEAYRRENLDRAEKYVDQLEELNEEVAEIESGRTKSE